jgi:hypothetical protein
VSSIESNHGKPPHIDPYALPQVPFDGKVIERFKMRQAKKGESRSGWICSVDPGRQTVDQHPVKQRESCPYVRESAQCFSESFVE